MKSSYRRKPELSSRRLQGFDYATGGAYFITIKIKDGIRHFGEIKEGKMILSELGMIAEAEWKRGEELRSEVELDIWQTMPDHFHAIVWIRYNDVHLIPTYGPLPQTPGYKAKMQDVSKNLSSLVRGFKGAVTRNAEKRFINDFAWQRSFHDRIIRNEKELNAIRLYIHNNPSRWSKR